MFIIFLARKDLIKTPNLYRCLVHGKTLKLEKSLNENDLLSLSHQSALSVPKKIKSNTIFTPDFVISSLKSYDFTDVQITKTLTKYPQLSKASINEIIKPKLDYYLNFGFSRGNLGKFISTYPRALKPSLERRIKPNVELLRSFLESNEQIISVVHKSSRLLQDNLKHTFLTNVRTLESYGIGHGQIAKFISMSPRPLLFNIDKFVKIVESVKEFGFDPMSVMFFKAVIAISSLSRSSWDKKLGIYKSLGLSEKDIISAFLKQPTIMNFSEDKIRKQFDFFAKELHWEPFFVVSRPDLLTYSLARRIFPRCLIMGILRSKGFVKQYPSKQYEFLHITEGKFMEKYITKYKDQVPEVLDVFKLKSKAYNG